MALPGNNKITGDLGHTDDHNAIVNEIIFVKNSYSTLDSPSFTGTPLAPTAASGLSNTQIANTQFVKNTINNLIDSAPETLDTLNKLAAALGDDANFATTVTNLLSTKLDSGTASTIYLTQSDASDLYFPISASGSLLTESEASDLYLPISASSTLAPIGYLSSSAAAEIYLRQDSASSLYLSSIDSIIDCGGP